MSLNAYHCSWVFWVSWHCIYILDPWRKRISEIFFGQYLLARWTDDNNQFYRFGVKHAARIYNACVIYIYTYIYIHTHRACMFATQVDGLWMEEILHQLVQWLLPLQSHWLQCFTLTNSYWCKNCPKCLNRFLWFVWISMFVAISEVLLLLHSCNFHVETMFTLPLLLLLA